MRERVEPEGIKRIPAAPEMRETIRRAAVAAAAMADSRQRRWNAWAGKC